MAKGNMLLGQARGKVGDVVFSRSNGQQVIRARSAVVKNPQSTKQTLQRILLNTISQAYSLMCPICDHSFEGINTGAQSMSAFMKMNLNSIRNRVIQLQNNTGSLSGFYSVTPVGSKAVAINPYIVATGTLPQIPVTAMSVDASNNGVAQITLPGVSDTITYESFINAYGLQRGDQVTFVCLTYTPQGDITFNYARIILDPSDEYGMPAAISSQLIGDGAVLNANSRNSGSFARLSEAEGVISFSVAGGTPVGAAVIVSREDTSGTWLRSNAIMAIPSVVTDYNQVSLLDAIDMFYSGGIDMTSAWYLNNAEQTSGSSSNNASSQIPYVSSAWLGGQAILGGTGALEITAGQSLPLVVNISKYSQDDNTKFVVTTRTLAIGDLYDSQAGEFVMPFSSQQLSSTLTISTAGTYNTYLVSGGLVRSAHKVLSVSAATEPTVTAATFGDVNLLTNTTIQTIEKDQQATLSVTVSGYNSMTTPYIMSIKTNQQPEVGETVSSWVRRFDVTDGEVSQNYAFYDAGMYYLILADGNEIKQVFSAINIAEGDALPSGGGGSEQGG